MGQSHPSRQWLRAAMVLQQQYAQRRSVDVIPVVPSLGEIHKHRAEWSWARQQQMPVAVAYCRAALQSRLRDVAHQLNDQAERLRQPEPCRPSLALLVAELSALAGEFETVQCDLRDRQVAVTTERIVLDELDLGPFEIRLHIRELGRPSPYTVSALDPHDDSSRYPHPHVQGDSLCEGDGHQAIASALEQGRLCEFFVLVRQVLRTYNDQSAYRPLSEWHGVDCAGCGTTVADEDRYCCDACSCSLCSDCESSCNTCHSSLCYECALTCSGCDDTYCSDCLTRCRDCGQSFCHDCHTDGRCSTCLEPEEEPLDENPTTITNDDEASLAAPSVYADSVGQAVVPA